MIEKSIFKSHAISVLGRCISALEPDDSQADIQRPRANVTCDIRIVM